MPHALLLAAAGSDPMRFGPLAWGSASILVKQAAGKVGPLTAQDISEVRLSLAELVSFDFLAPQVRACGGIWRQQDVTDFLLMLQCRSFKRWKSQGFLLKTGFAAAPGIGGALRVLYGRDVGRRRCAYTQGVRKGRKAAVSIILSGP